MPRGRKKSAEKSVVVDVASPSVEVSVSEVPVAPPVVAPIPDMSQRLMPPNLISELDSLSARISALESLLSKKV